MYSSIEEEKKNCPSLKTKLRAKQLSKKHKTNNKRAKISLISIWMLSNLTSK